MPDGGATSWPLVAAMLGSSAIGGITAPDGQELQSFEGTDNDPGKLMSALQPALFGHLNRVLEDADAPVRSEVSVNPPPAIVGRGLPMGIGVTGMDRRRLEGVTGQEPTTSGAMTLGRRRLNPETPQADTSALTGSRRVAPNRPALPRGASPAMDAMEMGDVANTKTDDFGQLEAALDMLMQSRRGRGAV